MAETRVVPSEKVYRQMFDAQVQLSLALYDSRRKRVVDEDVCLSVEAANSGSRQLNSNVNFTARNQLFSGTSRAKRSEDQNDNEEIWGLPDNIVPEKKNLDIIDLLIEKRRKDHNEVVLLLQTDLSSLSVGFEPLFRQTGDNILWRFSEHNNNIEKLMQRIESLSDLTAHSYEDMHDIWNKVCHESHLKKKGIKELDEIYAKYESERKNKISALLRKYTKKLHKISYLMPCDVQRLIDNEAMMINQALLANRCALARLCLNLMEIHLQMEVFQRMRWEDKLQYSKRIKLLEAVDQFKKFMNSPHIQNPKNIQDTLSTLKSDQKIHSELRRQTLEILRDMIPPQMSESSAVEWYSALSDINEKIDCMHIYKMKELHKKYENNFQECLAETDHFKTKVFIYGFTSDEIQHIVNLEIMPLIGQCQSKTKGYLAELDKAFRSLARISAHESKCLFEFMCRAAQLWEIHCAGLLNREQQLQNLLESISQLHDQENQKKEVYLDMLLDKLRQESSDEALKASLEKALTYFEEIKNGYVNIYKEGIEIAESYPSVILQELQAYSLSVSQFFKVKEVYGQDSEEFYTLYPFLKLGQSITAFKNEELKKELEMKHRGAQQAHLNNQETSITCEMDSQDCKPLIFSQAKETLTTAKGNVYSCCGFYTDEDQQTSLVETELVLYPKALIVKLLKCVRQAFFNHLEERFHIVLTNTMTVVDAKKEKLKAEVDLRLQLHQPRAKRIEDIHNVRAAELVLHQDNVDRHCRGTLEVLGDCWTELQELQIQQNKLTEDFRKQIYSTEDDFPHTTKPERIIKLCASLQTTLDKHLSIVQTLQRDFRQKIEFKMEGLREANAQILRSFKLFSEGGRFTPQEIQGFQSELEKIDKSIDLIEGAIIQDMEGRESKCLEQAKDILRQFEEKFNFLIIDLKFVDKMKQIFTSMRVLMKSEVLKSNMQKRNIDSILSNLQQIMAEYDKPCTDKKIITITEITSLTTSLMEELRMRCQYLECLLDASKALPSPQVPLQGTFAVATRPRSYKQDKKGSLDKDSLFQPSRIGVSFLEDVAVGVIKGLLKVGQPHDFKEVNTDSTERHSAALTGQRSGKSICLSGMEIQHRKPVESMIAQSVRRFSKPSCFDKRLQVFGSIPEEQQDSFTFKASITSILWKANNILLLVAEEFYKRKERRPVTCPQHLHETFEQCAEEIKKRLLIYQSQSLDYHNSCLQEFQLQLKAIEIFLSSIPEKLLFKLRDQYLKDLRESVTKIQHQFESVQQQSEQKREEYSSKLRVCLCKPACEKEFKQLVVAEEERQKQQNEAIQYLRQKVQGCVHKNAQEFVSALASLAEALLFQFDNLITIHEVQVGHAKLKRVNITTLIHQKQAGLLHEDRRDSLTQKSSRIWPGICYFGFTGEKPFNQQSKKTATITTVKTTLGHLKTIEVRDALHEHYGKMVQDELEKAQQECDARERQMQQWYKHWQSELETLTDQKTFYEH